MSGAFCVSNFLHTLLSNCGANWPGRLPCAEGPVTVASERTGIGAWLELDSEQKHQVTKVARLVGLAVNLVYAVAFAG